MHYAGAQAREMPFESPVGLVSPRFVSQSDAFPASKMSKHLIS